MKPKTKDFADKLIENPKLHQDEAYLMTHKTTHKATARANASRLLKQPNVQVYLKAHVDKAKYKIVKLVDSKREDIALKASESILDRELGKPLTRTNNVNMNISIEEAINSLE